MFIVTDEYIFTQPVKALVPVAGGHERQDFKATFRMLPAEQQDTFDLATTEGSTGFLKAIVVSLDELVDANKQAVPYSDAIRDGLLRWAFIRLALTNSYFGAVNKAIEGN